MNMFKASCFVKRILCLLICCMTVAGFAIPASAAIAVPDLKIEDRQMSVIHYGTGRNSQIVGNLDNGTLLKVVGETTSFYQIDCYGMICCIAKEQVRVDNNGCYYVNCRTDSDETVRLSGKTVEQVRYLRAEVQRLAEDQLGVPYCWGGTSPYGFDCSGFVQYIYDKLGYQLHRTCSPQMGDGVAVDPENLQPGDILFFVDTTYDFSISSHVGIYIDDGQFIHAGDNGVSYASMDQPYFADRFLCARRVILPGVVSYRPTPDGIRPMRRSSGYQSRGLILLLKFT